MSSSSDAPHAALNSQLMGEAAQAQAAGKTGNGKFMLSTGAWFLTEKYLTTHGANRNLTCDDGVTCSYRLDKKLVACLAAFFAGASVTELGGGTGHYQRAIMASGRVARYTAYDGVPNIERITQGRVHWADLSAEQPALVRSDYAMSLEVAEHIPPQHEAAYLANIDRANTRGLVISWSHFSAAKGQSAHGHVNAKSIRAVRELFKARGYTEQHNTSRHLQRCSTFPYFRTGITYFQRTG
jgi:hypothetical protein